MALFQCGTDEPYNDATKLLPTSIIQIPTYNTGFTIEPSFSYYYKKGTRVCLAIGVKKTAGTAFDHDTVCTLPTGYRPYKETFFKGCGGSVATGTSSSISIKTNGDVYVWISSNATVYAYIEFDAFG